MMLLNYYLNPIGDSPLNNNFTRKIIASILIAVFGFLGLIAQSAPEVKQPIKVTDLTGREVILKKPAERVILSLAQDIIDYAAIYGPGFMKTIVGLGLDLKQTNADMYNKYKEKFPEIDKIPEVGIAYAGSFDTEKAISLKPDLIIFSVSEKNGLKAEDLSTFEKAGIAVI